MEFRRSDGKMILFRGEVKFLDWAAIPQQEILYLPLMLSLILQEFTRHQVINAIQMEMGGVIAQLPIQITSNTNRETTGFSVTQII